MLWDVTCGWVGSLLLRCGVVGELTSVLVADGDDVL